MLCILKMLLVASVNEITGEYFDNISRVCIKCIKTNCNKVRKKPFKTEG